MPNDHAARERWVGFVNLLLMVLLVITFLISAQGLYVCARDEGIFGGIIDPCAQIGGSDSGTTGGEQGADVPGGTFFADCPPPDTGG